jgi:exonuclease SbcC
MREIRDEIAEAEQRHADWARLADDIGPSGIQAMEISAAEPELNELINDLLDRCANSRFNVRFETTRLSSDGKDEIEDCPIIVTDSEKGREAAIETFCGGERVILDEAISLAFTMLSCRHSGAEGSTLVRDETGAALAPEFGPTYVAMLRRAADIIQAAHVVFITHSRELQQLADVQLHFEAGRVRVCSPEAIYIEQELAA